MVAFACAASLSLVATACSSAGSGAADSSPAAADTSSADSAGQTTEQSAVSEESSGSGSAVSLADKTISLVGYGSANPWGVAFNTQLEDQLSSTGVKIQDLTTMDAGTQVQNFNQAVAQKPDLILVSVLDTKAMVVPIQKAKEAGIPVLAFDGPTDPSVADDLMSVLSDNEKLGEFAAQNIVEGLTAQGRDSGNVIVLTGTKSMLLTQQRMEGFNKVMATAPQFTVVSEQDANWDPTLSGQIAQQLLAKYGCEGVNGAYGMADYMALPIIQAAKQAGCAINGKDGIIVSGGNCFKAGIDSIKAGELYGTATEDPITVANQTATFVVGFLTGENPDPHQVIEEHRITAENVGEFAAQCSKA